MENYIDKLFILPIVMIIALLIFLVIKRHSPATKHTFTISMIVVGIEILILFLLSLAIPLAGVFFALYAIMIFSAWIIAIALLIGTVISVFIAWKHSKYPPRRTKFILKKTPDDHEF